MIRFAHPEYLNLLWAGIFLILIIVLEHRWRMRAMSAWASESLWSTALPNRSPQRFIFKRSLIVGAFLLIVFALSGPQVGTRLVEVTREGSDVVIAIDVSESMVTEDIAPNRMLRTRHDVTRLLEMLRGDRVALVPFAGVAFVQVPLTLDYSAVVSILAALEPGMIPQPGTSLSSAIKQARRAFSPEGKAQKVMVLITDGEDHEEGAVVQAKKAAEEGIMIFTIGMATPAGGPIPAKNSRGKIAGYKKDKQGATVISRLNDELLKEIASITGGEYFRSSTTGSELQQIYKRIAGLDKEQFESKEFTDYEDRFQWPLSAAFILILVEQAIPAGRRRRKT